MRDLRWGGGTLEWLTMRIAASRKGCTRQAILHAIHAGRIDAQQIGMAYVVLVNKEWESWKPQADPLPGTAVCPLLATMASPPSPATDRPEGLGRP